MHIYIQLMYRGSLTDDSTLTFAFVVFSNFNITAEGLDEDCANMFSDELWRCWFPAVS